MNRSGTEEEYGQQSQLLEDIYTFRKDSVEMQKKERESKQQKEKDDKRKAAMVGLGSKLKVNSLYRTISLFYVASKIHNQAGTFEKIIKLSNFKFQLKWQRFQACACLHSF